MTHDPLSDLIARMRNAATVGKKTFDVPASRLKKAVLDVLRAEGYVEGYEEKAVRQGVSSLTVVLKYYNGKPVIEEMKRVSKLGRRQYSSLNNLPLVRKGLGILILTTSQGVMSDREAFNKRLGGEILCLVY